ncbi:RHS repeat domain-containing protein [Streptomyces fuscichromogenes]|uniref:RHS repeat protein n=1 Tax=Streptomyces fuscichromogenes TaxID=1324013 RepID=A0A917XND8_9ACTN|nr:RHS repeat domain-containing protein [Streptomyces fuscichromogenes]GGN41933.1 hypothetical protein GCM10011578_090760 [Streptomyces fuscichromogenes]
MGVQVGDAVGVVTRYGYDEFGRPTTGWLPGGDDALPSTRISYALGAKTPTRVTTSTLRDNGNAARTDNGYYVLGLPAKSWCLPTSQQPIPNSTKATYDALGRAVKQITYTNADRSASTYTETTYDPLGNRTQIKDKSGRVWSWTYGSRHRVLTSTDPDSGTSRTWYDDQDHVTQTKDAKNQDGGAAGRF